MDLQLKDKAALVTGGVKGIGAAITRTCVQEGAIAVVVDRDVPVCQQLHEELRTQGLQISFVAMDLSPATNCKAIVQQATAALDHIDFLANNAGIIDKVGLDHGDPAVSLFVGAESSALLRYGVLRTPTFEKDARLNRQHQFEDRSYRPGQHVRIRCLEERDLGLDPRTGGRIAPHTVSG